MWNFEDFPHYIRTTHEGSQKEKKGELKEQEEDTGNTSPSTSYDNLTPTSPPTTKTKEKAETVDGQEKERRSTTTNL